MNYFAYGSNLFTYRLEKRVGKVEILGVAKLYSYKFAFDKISVDDSVKANLMRTASNNDAVFGVLFDVNPTRKGELDQAEGKDYSIVEIDVTLVSTGKVIRAFTYISEQRAALGSNSPYDWHSDFIVRGAEEHHLPADYINAIKSVESKNDLNYMRHESNASIIRESKAIQKKLTRCFERIFDLASSREFKIKLQGHTLDGRTIRLNKGDEFRFETDSPIKKGVQTHEELKVSDLTMELQPTDNGLPLFVSGKHFIIQRIGYSDEALKLLSGHIIALRTSQIDRIDEIYLRLIVAISNRDLKLMRDYQCK